MIFLFILSATQVLGPLSPTCIRLQERIGKCIFTQTDSYLASSCSWCRMLFMVANFSLTTWTNSTGTWEAWGAGGGLTFFCRAFFSAATFAQPDLFKCLERLSLVLKRVPHLRHSIGIAVECVFMCLVLL